MKNCYFFSLFFVLPLQTLKWGWWWCWWWWERTFWRRTERKSSDGVGYSIEKFNIFISSHESSFVSGVFKVRWYRRLNRCKLFYFAILFCLFNFKLALAFHVWTFFDVKRMCVVYVNWTAISHYFGVKYTIHASKKNCVWMFNIVAIIWVIFRPCCAT